jgi:hypothetical protein
MLLTSMGIFWLCFWPELIGYMFSGSNDGGRYLEGQPFIASNTAGKAENSHRIACTAWLQPWMAGVVVLDIG